MQKITTLALIIIVAFLAVQPAWSQETPQVSRDAAARPEPSVTAAQAQRALEVLQDDNKRKDLIQTLQTIARTPSPQALPAASPAVSADNLGVQVMVEVSNWFGEVSSQLANVAQRVTDFPMVLYWSVELAKDPYTRHTLLDTAWKLALVLACALAIEWLAWRALRRPWSFVLPLRVRRPAAAGAADAPPAAEKVTKMDASA